MSKDVNYNRMIQSKRWLLLRRTKLTANPLCEDCKERGIYVPASEIHHVIPCETASSVIGMQNLMFDYNNLRSLCHDCHVTTHRLLKSHSRCTVQERSKQATERFIKKFFS